MTVIIVIIIIKYHRDYDNCDDHVRNDDDDNHEHFEDHDNYDDHRHYDHHYHDNDHDDHIYEISKEESLS